MSVACGGMTNRAVDLLGTKVTSYPSLTRALGEALVDVLWFIEGS